MKNYLLYGFAMAMAGSLLTLVMFFAGFHTDPEKMQSTLAQVIGFVGPTAIAITVIVLGTKAQRAVVPETEPFGYAQALGVGVMIGLFASLFNLVFSYLYFAVINPDFPEVLNQTQIAAMEAKGLSSAQIERVEPMMRMMRSPAILTAFGTVAGFCWALVVSLIAAAFLKRKVADEPPLVA